MCIRDRHDAVDPSLRPFAGLDILSPRGGHSAILGLSRGRIRGAKAPSYLSEWSETCLAARAR
eukprot:2582160-Alexandrium_andersonii.AAC.1